MTNTINLIKIYVKETLSRTFNINGKKKFSSTALIMGLMFLLIALSMGYNLYIMAKSMNTFGFAKNIILVGGVFSAFMVLMLTITDVQGYLYKTKDYEMLTSLPLRQSEIVVSKLVSSYIITAIYSAMILLPTFIVYFIFCKITVANVIFAILALVLAPAFSQLICSVFAWLINALSSKMKNKMLMRSILSVVFAIGIIVVIYFANSQALTAMLSVEPPLWFKIVFPYINFLQKSMVTGSVLQFLIFAVICVGYMIIATGLVMLGYNRINKNLLVTSNKKSAQTKPIKYKQHSVVKSLMSREARGFVMSPTYLMNGIMGPLLAIVLSFMMYGIYKTIPYDAMVVNIFVILEVFTIPLCLGIAPTTSVSISMEGTKFLTLKSLPVNFAQIATSKILFNIALNLPCLLIGEIGFCLLMKLNFLIGFMIVLFSTLFLIMCSCLGLLINLRFPKLNWKSEVQASKQGVSLLLTMLIDMLMCIIPMIIFFVVLQQTPNINISLYIALSMIPVLIAMVVSFSILANKGNEMYSKIN